MADFPAYSRDELTERAKNLLRTRRRGIDVAPYSDYDLWARILGALAWAEQKRAEGLLLWRDPRRAVGTFLRAYADEYAVGRDLTETSTAATYAQGTVILLAGASGSTETQASGSVLRHADGTEFTLDSGASVPVLVAKTLYAGHLSSRRRIYQGHLGGGMTSVTAGEIYLAGATGEICAVKAADNQSTLTRHLVDLYNNLYEDPALHDTFVRQRGVLASVTAVLPGARGNKEAKETLALVSPSGVMSAEAHVVELYGGADAMTVAAMQEAILRLLGERAPMGTLEDIRQLALSCPRVPLSECYVAPGTLGVGTYTLLPTRADGPYVGAIEQAILLEHVAARLSPVDRVSAATIYEVRDTRIDVLNVQVSEIYRPDWALPDEGLTGVGISASTSTTVTLSVATAVVIGDRIVVTSRGTTAPYMVVRRVTNVASLVLTLDEALPFPADATGSGWVTPGGALAEAILDALYAAYAVRAPSAGTTTVRYPTPQTNDEAEALASAVSVVEGVLDVAFTSGADPDLSTPGGVLVPRCVLRMYT